jgi:hypothetical protein
MVSESARTLRMFPRCPQGGLVDPFLFLWRFLAVLPAHPTVSPTSSRCSSCAGAERFDPGEVLALNRRVSIVGSIAPVLSRRNPPSATQALCRGPRGCVCD